MSENTKIEWTDHTFNPWIGCSKVHAGCTNCYAEADFDKRRHFAQWGPNGTRVLTSESNWSKPLKWNREAEKEYDVAKAQWVKDCCAGYKSYPEPNPQQFRRRVFCASLADVFEDWEGPIISHDGTGNAITDPGATTIRPMTMQDVRNRLFKLIDATPWLDWLLLTKRPENVRKMWPDQTHRIDPEPYRHNVWIGTSVSDQSTADAMIPELLQCRDLAPVLFLSMEPLLGPIDLTRVGNHDGTKANLFDGNCLYVGDIGGEYAWTPRNFLRWIIVGGESGPNARPCNVEWIRSIVRQCSDAGVPCFVKQLGSNPEWKDGNFFPKRGSKNNDPTGWPEDLIVRQFPEVVR